MEHTHPKGQWQNVLDILDKDQTWSSYIDAIQILFGADWIEKMLQEAALSSFKKPFHC